MSDASPLFTEAELCTQARVNASALPYLVALIAKTAGQTPEAAALLVGRAFAPGWEELRGQGPTEVARMVALNMASLGGAVELQPQSETRVDVRLRGYPTAEDAAFFGVSREEADQFTGVIGPIAEFLGLHGSWHRAGEELVVTVEQSAA